MAKTHLLVLWGPSLCVTLANIQLTKPRNHINGIPKVVPGMRHVNCEAAVPCTSLSWQSCPPVRSLRRLAESKSSPKLHQSQGKNPSMQKATMPLGESPQNLVLLSYWPFLSVLKTEWDKRTNRWGGLQPLKVTIMKTDRFCEGNAPCSNLLFSGENREYSEAFDDTWFSALEKVPKR